MAKSVIEALVGFWFNLVELTTGKVVNYFVDVQQPRHKNTLATVRTAKKNATGNVGERGNKVAAMAEQLFQVIKERKTSFVVGKIKTFVVLSVRDNILFWLFDVFLGLVPDKYKHLFNFSEEAPKKQVAEMYQQIAVCEQNYIKFTKMIKKT
ncbi:hypothetical protein EIN_241710 [Entamoeba invadens IP1]|uniref:Uncharacterized protein n=1 Tax=Entamoeba invadens IP1 TaxID=370355 RepID=A0A0A1TUP9_ENTIV|nr:hypothetical protein EIN_241710 [Entamoeba invadens IP1]ELP83814.1 hypothetical protein EIN_241710 [Entamoeba invadens IP1]|eukprot:XP_004183160.1 hypothetical protein EIN_241710 [Entamoeba invadens IP1]